MIKLTVDTPQDMEPQVLWIDPEAITAVRGWESSRFYTTVYTVSQSFCVIETLDDVLALIKGGNNEEVSDTE